MYFPSEVAWHGCSHANERSVFAWCESLGIQMIAYNWEA